MSQNHCEHFRPLRGGIVIVAGTRQHFGTLGMVVTQTGADRWGLTCAHVLGPVGGPVPQGDAVFQPGNSAASFRIGATVAARADHLLDCAAFLIDQGLTACAEILGIGTTATPASPQADMRVVKSGRSTGLTEGVIESVNGTAVKVRLHPSFPLAYDLSEGGDSGVVWCDRATLSPVALHTGGTTSGPSVPPQLTSARSWLRLPRAAPLISLIPRCFLRLHGRPPLLLRGCDPLAGCR
jgi:endonuclease G